MLRMFGLGHFGCGSDEPGSSLPQGLQTSSSYSQHSNTLYTKSDITLSQVKLLISDDPLEIQLFHAYLCL